MDVLKFKTVNGVNIVELNNVLNALTLSVTLEPVKIEPNNVIDIETLGTFTEDDKTDIIYAVQYLGPVHYATYVQNKLDAIDENTQVLINQGIDYDDGDGVKNYSLSLVAQHNLDAIGGNFTDNVMENMVANSLSAAAAYAAVEASVYPARVSTTDGNFHSFATHTKLMAFKNASFGAIKTIYYEGQDLRVLVLNVAYGDFDAVDAIQDNR